MQKRFVNQRLPLLYGHLNVAGHGVCNRIIQLVKLKQHQTHLRKLGIDLLLLRDTIILRAAGCGPLATSVSTEVDADPCTMR